MVIRPPRRQPIRRPEDPATDLELLVSAGTPVGDVMTRTLVCVRSDLGLDAIRNVVCRRSVVAVAVVDAAHEVIGLLYTDRVLARPDDFEGPFACGTDVGPTRLGATRTRPSARDLMTEAYAIPMDTSVAQVATLMSCRALRAVIIVDDHRWVVGMLTSEDLVGWLALQTGFVAPARTELRRGS